MLLQLPLGTETQSCSKILGWEVGVNQDTNRFMSILLVKQEELCGTIKVGSKKLRSSVWTQNFSPLRQCSTSGT